MNEGINISGNAKIFSDQLSVGRNALSIKIESQDLKKNGYEDISDKIEILIQLLSDHKDKISNTPEMISSISTVTEELEKDQPNGTVIRGILGELAMGVSSVSKVAEAVAVLKAAILSIL
jgi:hypothetical protein